MRLTIRSMIDRHEMGTVIAYSDREARMLARKKLDYLATGDESGTGDNDVAGLYGPRGGFHGVVNLPRVGTQRQRRGK